MLSFYLTLIDSEEEKSKFEIIYELYSKRMWYTANQILNDSFEAEDAVHNALIGIARNISHIGEPDSNATLAYVVTAAKNAALNIATRNKNINVHKLEDFRDVPDENAIDNFCTIENKALIISALKKMPDIYRDLLYFHYFEELSEKEISAFTGIKYATVRKQISRAKAIFAKLIESEDSSYVK